MTDIDWTWGRGMYSLFTALAIIAFFLVRRWQPISSMSRNAITPYQRFALSMAAFIGGMFCAKAPFLILVPHSGTWNPLWLTDGKTVTTGLAGAYVSVELTKLWLGIRVKTGDSFAIPLAASLAIGRWGCFFNGCCFGIHTHGSWGFDFLGDGLRHPTQLYEIAFHASMGCLLWWMTYKNYLPTHRLQLYLIAYCAFRFMTETIRPEPRLTLNLTFYQWFCLCFATALAAQWALSPRPSPLAAQVERES